MQDAARRALSRLGEHAAPVAAESNWPSSTGNLTYDARLQISRTPDGNNVFYSWADSDSDVVQASFPHVSTSPDIYMKGYDLTANKMTCKKNMTRAKTNIELNAFFFFFPHDSKSNFYIIGM